MSVQIDKGSEPHVLIIGGGFGGAAATKALRSRSRSATNITSAIWGSIAVSAIPACEYRKSVGVDL